MNDTTRKEIIKELGFETMSVASQDAALESAGGLILQGVLMRIVGTLTDAERNQLDHLLGGYPENGGMLLAFLNEKVVNLEDVIRAEVSKFKQEATFAMGVK